MKQDKAVSVELVVALMVEFEKDWIKVTRDGKATDREVSEMLFPRLSAVTVFCGALRREEVPLMDFGSTKEFTEVGCGDGRKVAWCDRIAWLIQE